jgi:hypothetical protein
MKTITEYRPMIFSQLEAHATEHRARLHRFRTDLLLIAAYSTFGLWLIWDTGFAPWHWQFWLCFAPLFVAGELAFRQTQKRDEHEAAEDFDPRMAQVEVEFAEPASAKSYAVCG